MNTHFYNGKWHEGLGDNFTSVNPALNEQIWHGNEANSDQVEAAVNSARTAFNQWKHTDLADRTEILLRYQSILSENKEALGQVIADETGKPLWEALTEAGAMVGKIGLSIKAYEQRTGNTTQTQGITETALIHRPHGVLAVLGPYNFPGHLPNGHIVPALLAGNTIVFKPSELTPLVGQKLIEYLVQAGLPEGAINLVQGAGSTGALLSSNSGIDGLLFTGSSRTGIALHKQFGGQPNKLLALEMGGNNPLIFHAANDLKASVYHTIQSAYITAGQRCTCARKLIVIDNNLGREFVDALKTAINNLVVELPHKNPDTFYGPVISNKVADNLLEAQESLITQGAAALVKMKRLHDDLPLLSPGLLDSTNVDNLKDEELFGPLLQLFWVSDLDEAINLANDTQYGLAAGILTDDDESWDKFYQTAHCGILNRNRATTGASGAAPFGGVGNSGNHRPSAFYAADYCSYPMASMADSQASLPDAVSKGIKL